MKQDHGTTLPQTTVGVVTAIAFNLLFAVSILWAGHMRGDVDPIAAAANDPLSGGETHFCRYMEAGRLFQVEVVALSWQSAEEQVCGTHLRDVRLPPTLLKGYALLTLTPSQDRLLAAHRESCSCSSQSAPAPVLQDIGIVQPPRLGTQPKQTALPRLVNTPPPAELNVVDPKATTPPDTPRPNPKDDRARKELRRNTSFDALMGALDTFDEARPVSSKDGGGSPDGSRYSTSATGTGDPYLQRVKARLDNNMNAPASIPRTEMRKLKARLWIRIGENGSVWDWSFESKSGNSAFDNMIERTIQRFVIGGDLRFHTPPDEWRLQRISILVDGSEIR